MGIRNGKKEREESPDTLTGGEGNSHRRRVPWCAHTGSEPESASNRNLMGESIFSLVARSAEKPSWEE